MTFSIAVLSGEGGGMASTSPVVRKEEQPTQLAQEKGDHDARSNCSGVSAGHGRALAKPGQRPSPGPAAEGQAQRPHPRANAPKDERELTGADVRLVGRALYSARARHFGSCQRW